jgi:hypothetical protein
MAIMGARITNTTNVLDRHGNGNPQDNRKNKKESKTSIHENLH